MHILVFPSWHATTANPMRGSFLREQAHALHKAGHQVGIMAPPTRLRTRHGVSELAHHWRTMRVSAVVSMDEGVPTYRIPWWGWGAVFSYAARGALALRVFDDYCQAHGTPDVLHAHSSLYGGYLAAWIARERGIPMVMTEHATFIVRGQLFPAQREAVRVAVQTSRRVLTAGITVIEALQKLVPEQTYQFIGESIDATFFTLVPPPASDTPFVVSLIARLSRAKRVDVLLEALARLGDASVVLRVGGDGEERAALETLMRTLGLEQQVTFLGRVTREQVRDLIRESHAVVSSSDIETFGITLIEGMATGRPVIATRSGGPELFVNDANGLIVPPGDPQALADALRMLKANYRRYDGERIRAGIVERFSEQSMVARLEAIYGEVKKKPHP